MASNPITSRQTEGGKVEAITDFTSLGSKIIVVSVCSHKMKTLALWKESYDQPRQHIKKQRHHFANKGPYSQSYDFSSSHIQRWGLDHKEGWVPKNWCFWIIVLEKTLESPLDSKIKPVYRKLTLNIHWKDQCWSWSSNILAPWCEELTHWKRPWCWERLRAGGEGDDIG